ncbi:hypothetical protein SAMN05444062_11180 [Pseudomonas syringae]|uniref:DUF5677 domain-containing protein n=1 Tax=Pseudomonas syringae TaxID=317 RepID=UPI0008F2B1D4|nr:DUF5677 domain-containing protein [Pseudomonas syringae]SFH70900.1 hypothetical protein SAMN05444062_11180 [Pseudomonas syringae]
MKPFINLQQDSQEIKTLNQQLNSLVARNKEVLLESVANDPQRIIIRRYLSVLYELCQQASKCLDARAYSTLEALSRIIIEQSANMLYISLDKGDNALALLRSSKQLTESNGKAWSTYLESQGAVNPAAQARQNSGANMLARFDKRWPGVERYPGNKGLFRALGWESHYYAFYSPLCDSVHSFSDEMSVLVDLGELFSISMTDGEEALIYWNKERLRLATYHYAIAIGLRAEAFSRCCNLLAPDLADDAAESFSTALNELIIRHDHFDHTRLEGVESGTAKFEDFFINT